MDYWNGWATDLYCSNGSVVCLRDRLSPTSLRPTDYTNSLLAFAECFVCMDISDLYHPVECIDICDPFRGSVEELSLLFVWRCSILQHLQDDITNNYEVIVDGHPMAVNDDLLSLPKNSEIHHSESGEWKLLYDMLRPDYSLASAGTEHSSAADMTVLHLTAHNGRSLGNMNTFVTSGAWVATESPCADEHNQTYHRCHVNPNLLRFLTRTLLVSTHNLVLIRLLPSSRKEG